MAEDAEACPQLESPATKCRGVFLDWTAFGSRGLCANAGSNGPGGGRGDPVLRGRHAFTSFRPHQKWRGYFVIGRVAASSCFNDGLGGQHSRPRVKSTPMGWSSIVDFIQSSLERFRSLAGIPAERVVKMGEQKCL